MALFKFDVFCHFLSSPRGPQSHLLISLLSLLQSQLVSQSALVFRDLDTHKWTDRFFCSISLSLGLSDFFHDRSKLFIHGTITAELMLFPSLYLVTEGQSVVVIILTAAGASLIPWLRWCLWVPHLEHDCHPFVVDKYPEDALNLCRPCFAAATLPSGIHQLICLPVISAALARCWSSLPVPVVVTGLPPEGRAIPSP